MPTLRTEIFHGADALGRVLGGVSTTVDDSPSEAWEPAVAGDEHSASSRGRSATLEAFDGAVYVAFGETPDPTVEPRRLVRPGSKVMMRINPGERMSAVAAADIPA